MAFAPANSQRLHSLRFSALRPLQLQPIFRSGTTATADLPSL